jgi:ABC-type sugar transport system ATPase subunit
LVTAGFIQTDEEQQGYSKMGDILRVSKLSKSFPGVRALKAVDFDLRPGEVHGLMGENGAGKSTLIKVITGFYRRDEGEILYDGAPVEFKSPNDAVRNGVSTVYQEINLIPMLSVAENIFIGRQPVQAPEVLTGRPSTGGLKRPSRNWTWISTSPCR